ncbi:MAG: hypothetical protein LBE13_16080 [Bacteroidales bacterium]|jgi:hypothetical protein|nr:hypothetical protein [Bacteroidales bacterium]
MPSTTEYEIISKGGLRDRIEEFENMWAWMPYTLKRLNEYEMIFHDDDSIRKAIEDFSFEIPESPFDSYIVDLIQIICDGYFLCNIFTIGYLRDIRHIFEIMSDEALTNSIAKSLKVRPSYSYFDAALREMLNNNLKLNHREDENIMTNDSLR